MKFSRLGNSDLDVSAISLGTYYVGVDPEKAVACINHALNSGINFIDTANAYGRGASESLLGDVLQYRGRDTYVLATKVYFPVEGGDGGYPRCKSTSRSMLRSNAYEPIMWTFINATDMTTRRP